MAIPNPNPILNAPYREPNRHFRFDDDGITNDVIEKRRLSGYFVPIPQQKKRDAYDATEAIRQAIRTNRQ